MRSAEIQQRNIERYQKLIEPEREDAALFTEEVTFAGRQAEDVVEDPPTVVQVDQPEDVQQTQEQSLPV